MNFQNLYVNTDIISCGGVRVEDWKNINIIRVLRIFLHREFRSHFQTDHPQNWYTLGKIYRYPFDFTIVTYAVALSLASYGSSQLRTVSTGSTHSFVLNFVNKHHRSRRHSARATRSSLMSIPSVISASLFDPFRSR